MVHLADFEPIPEDVLNIFPVGLVRRNLVIPVAKRGDRLIAVVPKTEGIVKPEGLRLVAGCTVDLAIAPLEEIISFIEKHFPETPETTSGSSLYKDDGAAAQPEEAEKEDSGDASADGKGEVEGSLLEEKERVEFPGPPAGPKIPAILETLLKEARKHRANEILIEQRNENFKFRFRIKGILLSDGPWQKWSQSEFLEMVFSARSLGAQFLQAGVRWTEARRVLDLEGEKLNVLFKLSETDVLNVLSIHIHPQLDKVGSPTELGMDASQAKLFEALLSQTRGLVLFCGMDYDNIGETMRNCLRRIATPKSHVMVVENNLVEWIPEANQYSASGDEKLFGELLKVNLKHLPDLLMVDPLVKKEHLETCLRFALDGSRIFGRFYAWDSADALAQLVSMGIDPHLIRFGISGFITQRTLRMNCPNCQKKDEIRREQTKEIGIPVELVPPFFYRGEGCESCHHSGFDREIDIFEVIVLTEELKKQISSDLKSDRIHAAIRSEGMLTLRQVAVHKAIDGQTSLAEVIRTTLK